MNRKIAIITDEPGWHGEQLRTAFADHDYASQFVSIKDCHFNFNEGFPSIELPGFARQFPYGVFVRGVPGGSLEQVVLYLDILHALRALNIVVYNDAKAIERTVDKAMTSFLLQYAGIPTPPTWVTSRLERFHEIVDNEIACGHELVLKPLFGSQGEGLERIDKNHRSPRLENCNGVFYLQRFIETGENHYYDWRIFVVNGRAIAGMRRNNTHWVSNVANGGSCHRVDLDDSLCRLAESATKVVGIRYAGVDVMRDRGGKTWVLEINSIPAWKGLQGTTDLTIAEVLVDDFLKHCGDKVSFAKAG